MWQRRPGGGTKTLKKIRDIIVEHLPYQIVNTLVLLFITENVKYGI